MSLHANGLGCIAATVLLAAVGASVASAQSSSRACTRLTAEASANLTRFESHAAALVLARTAVECRERLAEFSRVSLALEAVYNDLSANRCQIDRRLQPDERRKAAETIGRWDAHCALLDKPATPPAAVMPEPVKPAVAAVPKTAERSSTASRGWVTMASLAFLSIAGMALAVLAFSVGRLSRGTRHHVQVMPAPGEMETRRPGAVVAPSLSVQLQPAAGGPSWAVEPWRLDGSGVTVGRDAALCDIVLTDRHVSARHARIWRDRNGVHVQDLGSMNGVWKNGRRITTSTLSGREEISLGETIIRVAGPADVQQSGGPLLRNADEGPRPGMRRAGA